MEPDEASGAPTPIADAEPSSNADEGDAGDDAGDDDGDDADDALGRDRARKAATALGVGLEKEEPSETSGTPETQGPQNRAERRRALAQKRRKGKGSAFDEAPKDRNLRKRQEALEKRKGTGQGGDEAGEPSDVSLAVDDALARTGAAAGRWLKRNSSWIQWALVAGIAGGIGSLVYVWRTGTTNAATSDLLANAIAAEQARVVPADKDKRTEDEKKKTDRVVYATYEERDKVALERYEKAALSKAGSGPSVLARLGSAGTQLDRREWDTAIAGFEDVLRSKLAEADPDVKGRALEGLGFAYEGKKDPVKATATFEKLADLSPPIFKALSKYHRARVLLAKPDKDGAKKLLEETRKDIETAELEVKRVSGGSMNPFNGLRNTVEQTLKRIDPNAVPPKFIQGGALDPSQPRAPGPGNAGMQITPEQMKQLLEQRGVQPGMPARPE